jgi:branched-chain amino acid transport system substrate-binding protein
MRRFARAASAVVTIVVVAAALSACGSSSSSSSSSAAASAGATSGTGTAATKAQTSCPVKVLMLNSFTGGASQNGQADLVGAKVAISQINSTGGVLGCPIKLTTVDDQSNFSQDLPLLEKALSGSKYAMVMNGDFACSSTAPLLTRLKILSIAGCGQLHFAGKAEPYDFDVIYVEARAAAAAADFGVQKKGYKKWALLVDNTAIGQGDIAALKSELAKDGAAIVDTEQLPLTGVNFSAAVERAKAANPDVVFSDMFGASAAHLKSDIQTAGWKVPQIGGFDESATSFKGLVPASALKGQYEVSQATMASPPNATRAAFIDKLKTSGVKINEFLFGYANGHDPLILFAWAANRASSIDTVKVAAYLHSHGTTPVPNMVQGMATGYTPNCGEFAAPNGLAVMKAGFYDSSGQLPGISVTSGPALPASLNDC